jgi:long-chain acyl-CoA synthetase
MLSHLAPLNTPAERILAQDDAGRVLRYGDLPALTAQWQASLPGRRVVLLLCGNTVPHLAAYAGLHGAGHVLILLPATTAESTLADLRQRYQAEAVVRADASGGMQITQLQVSAGELHPDLSICLSTSGSTGSPKLVRFSHEQLVANACAIRNYLAIGSDEVAMAHLPFEYSFGLSVLHSHVAAGARVLLSEHSIMQKSFWTRLSEATSLSGVPFHYEMLWRMRIDRMDLPRLRTLTQAGGHMAPELVAKVHALASQRGWQFHLMYGQTEAGPRIGWLSHALVAQWPGCIGQAIPGVQLSLQDGELVVQSPSVMLGYALNRAELALGDDMGGRLHTGDLAEEAAPGIYRITGRKSRFLKLQGNRVSLQDVEERLQIAGHAVHALGQDNQLLLCTTDTDTDDVRQSALALFSFPPRSLKVQRVAEMPRTPNGKIDYPALARMANEGAT